MLYHDPLLFLLDKHKKYDYHVWGIYDID